MSVAAATADLIMFNIMRSPQRVSDKWSKEKIV